ncbi:MAG: acetylglucosamine-6-sulfatase [Pedosphaera sp. Tous-C6FEB]|nr:MAG: acetylglucosamine-6-sulfatase [Pedosphaera sp. Tous-C6FEB]
MNRFTLMRRILCAFLCVLCGQAPAAPRNILFILADDHRHDALSFMGHPYLETPHLDRLARGGVHCRNAFVTTSLCSPSRASILTGLYAHAHGVVDNYNPVRTDLVFFPQLLQRAGYETAFFGKWHMGETDAPQRGFDHWVAFKGQGNYWADGRGTTRVVPQSSSEGYNVNGQRVPQRGYITDELTDFTLDWLKARKSDKPFFAYLSHKAVHSDFVAADRHVGRYAGKTFVPPKTFADTPENYLNKPMWVRNQRNSRHGVDFGYNLPNFDLQAHHRRYCEALLAVDDSVGRLTQWLAERKLLDSTLVVYMGDNGFHFGEHGLIDKRTAYEASMRVPLLLHCPELFKAGTVVTQMVANIDLAPTLLDVAADVRRRTSASNDTSEIRLLTSAATRMHGRSFLKVGQASSLSSIVPVPAPAAPAKATASQKSGGTPDLPWRDALLYEYNWERNYPYTPTMHAVRTDRWKYIRYHGIWDVNELYDLAADPDETRNLIHDPAHAATVKQLNARLFELLAETQGQSMPLLRDLGETFPTRKQGRATAAEFPAPFVNP